VSKESTQLRRTGVVLEGPRGAVSKKSTQLRRTGAALEGPLCAVLDEGGTLWRESRSSVTGDAVKRYITIPSHHQRSSGSSSTLHHIKLVITSRIKYTLVSVSTVAIYHGCSSL